MSATTRARSARARVYALAAAVAVLVSACKKSDDTGALNALDLKLPDGAMFNPNEIIDSQSFTDSSSLAEGDLVQFLQGNPYGGSSFLVTYQSDGVSAADAVLNAGQTYKINPLVFFVEAEVTQGLISAANYPSDAARVEYVFRCGCYGPGDCDPAFAGFDKQVSCLGQQLRTALDAMAASGKTSSGWGPMVAKTSVDGVSVSPADDSTAALYDYDPYVGAGSSGQWLTWNVWNLYATQLGYNNASGPPMSGWVGDACFTAEGCDFASAVCARGGYPSGMCTKECTSDTDCPNDKEHTTTFCAEFSGDTNYCVVSCSEGGVNSCRDQYKCASVKGTSGTNQDACIPAD